MDYSSFLPDIDIEDGKRRVMGNMSLYLRLLGRFDGTKMAGAIADAMEAQDEKALASAAHALKGTTANLSFPVVLKVVGQIDALAKEGKDCTHLKQVLLDATDALNAAIARVLETADSSA